MTKDALDLEWYLYKHNKNRGTSQHHHSHYLSITLEGMTPRVYLRALFIHKILTI